MSISEKREYVLVSWKWSWKNGYLLFWGEQTEDQEKRSFGGYTQDVDTCEKYSKEDLKEKGFPFWRSRSLQELDREKSYAVKISDLHKFGAKQTVIRMY